MRDHFAATQSEDLITEIRGSSNAVIFGSNFDLASFVSFSTDTPETINIIAGNSGSTDFEVAGDIDPTDLDRAYALTLNDGELYEINIPTGTYTFIVEVNPPGDEQWTGIEFDPATNLLYGISSNFSDSSTLSIIEIGDDLSLTPIGTTGMLGAIAIATDGAGNFYGYDVVDDSFYNIDPTTGQATLIGVIGFDANFGQDLEWDPITETMYMTAFNSGNGLGELRTVDLITGQTTLIGTISSSGDQITWASIPIASTLTINDTQLVNFTVYPNPVKDNITLTATMPIDNIIINNLLGQNILEKDINSIADKISVETLENGIYLIQIFSGETTETIRFIKN